jgi:hypothetical protein
MKIRLVFRGFSDDTLIFRETKEIEEHDMENVLPAIAVEHGCAMVTYPNVTIEIEFLDEPDVNRRFFRFGTTPARMRQPFEIDMAMSDEMKREALEKWGKG